MEQRIPETDAKAASRRFPSAELVVILYGAGALTGLGCAFLPGLEAGRSTSCLLLSWLLALGAFAVSVFSEDPELDNDFEL